MFDMTDTAFSYEREFIVCSFLQDFSEGIGSSLQLMHMLHFYFVGQRHVDGLDNFQNTLVIGHLEDSLC